MDEAGAATTRDAPAVKPPRTWRPMILWTLGLLAALGLAWFVGAVVVPVWGTQAAVKCCCEDPWKDVESHVWSCGGIDALGGPEGAIRRLSFYLRLPVWIAPYRPVAVVMMGACGEKAIPELLVIHGKSEGQMRTAAQYALVGINDSRAVEPLLEALRNDRDQWLPAAAAERLGAIGDRRAVEPLIAALRNGPYHLRRATPEALAKLEDPRVVRPLLAALRDKDERVAKAASEAIVKIGGLELEPLTKALSPPYYFPGSPLWWPDLTTKLRLNQVSDPRIFELLAAVFEDSSCPYRFMAAAALGDLGDQRAVQPLIATLVDTGQDAVIRLHAAWALGELGDRRAVEPLIGTLKSVDTDLRTVAAQALGELGDARAIEPLKALSGNEQESVRAAAAQALAKIRGEPPK